MKFLRNLLAVLAGLFIFSGFLLILFFAIVSAITSEEAVELEKNTVLHLKLTKPIRERETKDPFANFFPGVTNSMGLIELREALAHAKDDDNIVGILLEAPWLAGGFATGEEVRKALINFKDSGKFIIAYSDIMTEGGYYLSSVADEVYLNPTGEIEFNGLNAELVFFKGSLEKLGIEPQIFRVGKYKSAIEPFTREDMSPESEEQLGEFVNGIYDNMLKEISESRGISKDDLEEISDKYLVRNSKDAREKKLITDLKYYDEVLDILKEKIGLEDDEEVELVSYSKYRKSYSKINTSKNRIAVIVASGEIVWGKGGKNMIGSTVFAKEIRKAADSKNIKAIVLRVNSPGGNYLASDIIWREIQEAKKIKPVIASMSDYAASGGYYIAMGCDTIVAQHNTITGSIGIFRIFFNMGPFMKDKLGITTDSYGTGEFSDLYTSSRNVTEFEREIIQKGVDEGYLDFTTKAAEARNMELEELQEIASGRVWTGDQAIDNGLVDVIGGLDDAIKIAAEKAGVIDDYKIRVYPIQKDFWQELAEELSGDVKSRILQDETGDLFTYFELLNKIKYWEGLQTRLPFEIRFK